MNAAPTILGTKDLSQGSHAKWAGYEIPTLPLIAASRGVAGFCRTCNACSGPGGDTQRRRCLGKSWTP